MVYGGCRYAVEATDKQTNERSDRQTDGLHRCIKRPRYMATAANDCKLTYLESEMCRGGFVIRDELVPSDTVLRRVSICRRVNRQSATHGTGLHQLTNERRPREYRRVVVYVQNFQRHLKTATSLFKRFIQLVQSIM